MIPVVLRIPEWIPLVGGQPVTSFGVLLLLAFLAAGKFFVDGVRAGEPEARGWDLVVTAAIAGLLGAKLMHLAVSGLLGLPTGLGRTGLDWFGGLIGGGTALFWHARVQGLDTGLVAGAAAAPAALGYAIGRLGSFLVGSEYGVPTELPWGIAFPAGRPPTTPANLMAVFGLEVPEGALRGGFARVHPTQLYEGALSLGVFALVRARRGRMLTRTGSMRRPEESGGNGSLRRNESRMGGWWILGLFLTLHGVARGVVEPLRAKADRLAGPISVDLLLAVAVAAAGVALMMRCSANRGRNPTC